MKCLITSIKSVEGWDDTAGGAVSALSLLASGERCWIVKSRYNYYSLQSVKMYICIELNEIVVKQGEKKLVVID